MNEEEKKKKKKQTSRVSPLVEKGLSLINDRRNIRLHLLSTESNSQELKLLLTDFKGDIIDNTGAKDGDGEVVGFVLVKLGIFASKEGLLGLEEGEGNE